MNMKMIEIQNIVGFASLSSPHYISAKCPGGPLKSYRGCMSNKFSPGSAFFHRGTMQMKFLQMFENDQGC